MNENDVDAARERQYVVRDLAAEENANYQVVDKIGVHVTHCCSKHGCKYGKPDCPVAWGTVKQAYRCEYCDMDWEDQGKPSCSVLTHATSGPSVCAESGYWKWQGNHHKTSFSLEGVLVFFWLCDEHDELHRSAQKSGRISSWPVEKRVL